MARHAHAARGGGEPGHARTSSPTTRSASRSSSCRSTATGRRTSACRCRPSGRTLETMLGSRIVTTFLDRRRGIQRDPAGARRDRATPAISTTSTCARTTNGELIPLSNLVQLEELAGPTELQPLRPLRAITIAGRSTPGYTLGEALDYMEKVIARGSCREAQINYDGESREFKQSGGALYITFMLALLIVFLVLAAQFESFLHPVHHHDDGAAGASPARCSGCGCSTRLDQHLQPDRLHHADRPRRPRTAS